MYELNEEIMKDILVFISNGDREKIKYEPKTRLSTESFDKLFTGKKYIVFKEGKRFAICIEGITVEDIRNITLPIFRNEIKEREALTEIFNKLNRFICIYHVLDLGNSVYLV